MVRRIVGLGGGGFSKDPFDPVERLLDDFVLGFARRKRPRICFVSTASGDADSYALNFYRAFADRAVPSDLSLFGRPRADDLREFVLSQDIVYVGGGNTLNMLSVWRPHGLDAILREAWEAGVVLAGISAGLICWFAEAATDAFGNDHLSAATGLGLLAGSACAHYSNVPYRRPEFGRLIGEGMAPGIGVDDHVALVYRDTSLEDVVTTDAAAAAYRVSLGPDGIREERLEGRILVRPS